LKAFFKTCFILLCFGQTNHNEIPQKHKHSMQIHKIKGIGYCGEIMIKRGQLYYADLSPVVGSEQGGVRPVLILQNDVGNKFSPTVIAAATTSKLTKAKLPTHISLEKEKFCLPKDSIVLLEQIRTIDKSRLLDYIGELPNEIMNKVNNALMISLGFFSNSTAQSQEN